MAPATTSQANLNIIRPCFVKLEVLPSLQNDFIQKSRLIPNKSKDKGLLANKVNINLIEKAILPNKSSQKTKSCLNCRKKFSLKSSLAEHTRKCEHRPKCEICGDDFSNPHALRCHVRLHKAEKEKFSCVHCKLCFTTGGNLKRHIETKHNSNSDDEEAGESSPPKQNGTPRDLTHCKKCWVEIISRKKLLEHQRNCKFRPKCEICGKDFIDLQKLKSHKVLHDPEKEKFTCDICSKDFTNIHILKRHIRATHDKEKSFKCEECGKRFARKDQLESHSRLHSNLLKYKCDRCHEKFRHLATLNHHTETKHLSDDERKKYPCDLCEDYFFTRGKLETHKDQAHGIAKPKNFQCDLCDRHFISSTGYREHIGMHLLEKPFKCEVCGKPYVQKSNLTTHLKMHKGIRPHKCDRCGAEYANRAKLKDHLKLHDGIKDFSCFICNAKFRLKRQLNLHIRSHVEERPYKCSYCGKGFKHGSSLRTHEKLHNGDKKHVCKKCGKAYVQLVNLRWHERRYSGACTKLRTGRGRRKK